MTKRPALAFVLGMYAVMLCGCPWTGTQGGLLGQISCTGAVTPQITTSFHFYSMEGTCTASEGNQSAHYYVQGTYNLKDKTATEMITLGANLIMWGAQYACPDGDPFLTDAVCTPLHLPPRSPEEYAAEYGIELSNAYYANKPLGRHIIRQILSPEQFAALQQRVAVKENPSLAAPACTLEEWRQKPTVLFPFENATVPSDLGPKIHVQTTCVRDEKAPNHVKLFFKRLDTSVDPPLWKDVPLANNIMPLHYVGVTPPYAYTNDRIPLTQMGKYKMQAVVIFDEPEECPQTCASAPSEVEFRVGMNSELTAAVHDRGKMSASLGPAADLIVEDFQVKRLNPGDLAASGAPVGTKSWEFSWSAKNIGQVDAAPSRISVMTVPTSGSLAGCPPLGGVYPVGAIPAADKTPANQLRISSTPIPVQAADCDFYLTANYQLDIHETKLANNRLHVPFKSTLLDPAGAQTKTTPAASAAGTPSGTGSGVSAAPRQALTALKAKGPETPQATGLPTTGAVSLKKTAATAVVASKAVLLPRLVVARFSAAPASPAPGQALNLFAVVTNNGKAASGERQKIALSCAVVSGSPDSCPVADVEREIGKIEPGKSKTITFSGKASAAGEYSFTAVPKPGSAADGKVLAVAVKVKKITVPNVKAKAKAK